MAQPKELDAERAYAGLCADCAHGRRIQSDRGSVFYLCELSASDPSYAKYPRLPVICCNGHERDPLEDVIAK
jgi:hypothetical protein